MYHLGESEAERILTLEKTIRIKLHWQRDEHGNWFVRVPVECKETRNLEWYARYNPLSGNYTSILFWQKQTIIRRLDIGKSHQNPDGTRVGRLHKHRLTDKYGDRVAYEPPEMSLVDDMVTTLGKFLEECNVEPRVNMLAPPTLQQDGLGI